MISRRGFLGALIAAPAIVRAESLMKIIVPKQELLVMSSLTQWSSSEIANDVLRRRFDAARESKLSISTYWNEVSKIVSMVAVNNGTRSLAEHDAFCATLSPVRSKEPFRIEVPEGLVIPSAYELARKAQRRSYRD